MSTQSLIMFMSHGSSYLNENQRLHERIVKILEDQLKEAFDGLRMRENSAFDDDDQEEYEDDFNATGGAAGASNSSP